MRPGHCSRRRPAGYCDGAAKISQRPHDLKELGVDDPDAAFEAGMRELKAAAERAQTIIARVFGP